MKRPRRRQFLHLAAGGAALPVVSRSARAQTYPMRPARIVVGFPPGTATDITARLIGQWLSERLGQPFIIENRPGAGSNMPLKPSYARRRMAIRCSSLVLRMRSMRRCTTSSASISSAISRLSAASFASLVMVVNPSLPVNTVPEFIAYAKANPGKINMASAGNGNITHMDGELFKMMTGVEHATRALPRRRAGADRLIGGQVQVMFVAMLRPSNTSGLVSCARLR